MEQKFYKVLSALKHDGDLLQVGTYVMSELTAFEDLAKQGILKLIEGAESMEHAMELDGAKQATEVEEVKPKNTWGPTDPEKEADTTTDTTDADTTKTDDATKPVEPTLKKYKVLKEFTVENKDSKNFGTHAVDSFIEADPAGAQGLVDNGTLELVADTTDADTGDNL
jgi:hypothetical protein